LVNDIFGGDRYMEWDKPLWEHDWAGGLAWLRRVSRHLDLDRGITGQPLGLSRDRVRGRGAFPGFGCEVDAEAGARRRSG